VCPATPSLDKIKIFLDYLGHLMIDVLPSRCRPCIPSCMACSFADVIV
jgi:hypothetical protein